MATLPSELLELVLLHSTQTTLAAASLASKSLNATLANPRFFAAWLARRSYGDRYYLLQKTVSRRLHSQPNPHFEPRLILLLREFPFAPPHLHWALTASALANNIPAIAALLAAGADPAFERHHALVVAAVHAQSEAVALLARRLKPADLPAALEVPLRLAAHRNLAEVAGVLLKAGADPNVQQCSPLRAAARFGHVEVARVLLDGGARASAEALRIAVEREKVGVARLLLEAGASVGEAERLGPWERAWPEMEGQVMPEGAALLRGACRRGDVEMVRMLLSHGVADPTMCTRDDIPAGFEWHPAQVMIKAPCEAQGYTM